MIKNENYIMNGFYGVHKTHDGYCLQNGVGFILDTKETIEIAFGLLNFAYKNREEIKKYNENLKVHIFDGYTKNKTPKYKKPRYLYLFECQNRYKIGITDNIKRRTEQLDTRPFKLNLIAQTNKPIKDAYRWEQYLHDKYNGQNIKGEWFDLTENQIEDIISLFKNLEYVKED